MLDGQLKPIKGVKPVRKTLADGTHKLFFYHRATKRRLPDDPNSKDFADALREAERIALHGEQPVETLSTLIREYCASPDWTQLAASTREIEAYNLSAIESEFGGMELAAIDQRGARAMFLEWHDELAQTQPRGADAKLTRLARILRWAYDRERIMRHPLDSWTRAWRSDRSDCIWTEAHFDALNRSKASAAMKLAAFAALHTGQRKGDLISLRWSQFDGSGITLTPSKSRRLGSRGKLVYIPATKALKTTLGELKERRKPAPTDRILLTARCRPWTSDAFRLAWQHAFAAACAEAKGSLPGFPPVSNPDDPPPAGGYVLHFHDIRGTAVTMLAEAGCTVPEIATITGHSLQTVTKILERYLSRTRALAESAIGKLELRLLARQAAE